MIYNDTQEFLEIVGENFFEHNYRIAMPTFYFHFYEKSCWFCKKDILVMVLRSDSVMGGLDNKKVEAIKEGELVLINDLFTVEGYKLAVPVYHYWLTKLPNGVEQWVAGIFGKIKHMVEKPLPVMEWIKTAQMKKPYWASHCPCCKKVQGDFHIHETPSQMIDYDNPYFIFTSLSEEPMLIESVAKAV